MLARIVGHGQTALLDLEVAVQSTASIAGRLPSLTFTVRRDSAGWGHPIIDERGGFLVTVNTPRVKFRSVADRPVPVPEGLRFTGISPHHWLANQPVPLAGTYYSALAGHIIRSVVRGALELNPPLMTLGRVLMAPPLVNVTLRGQSVADLLDDLREQTNHEWYIDDDFRFHWVPFEGRYREQWLVDDGLLMAELQPESLLDVAAQVMEVEPDGGTWTDYDGTVPVLWPSRRVVRL